MVGVFFRKQLRQVRSYRSKHQVLSLLCLTLLVVGIYRIYNNMLSKQEIHIDLKPVQDTMKSTEDYKEGWITDYPQIENMIILPCHSVFAPELNEAKDYPKDDRFAIGMDPNNWLMASFQKKSNDQYSFMKHMEHALLELHANIGNTALVVSGGFTKPEIEKSEASSYLDMAKAVGFLKNPYFRIGTNILLEEHARDSHENVLYSLSTFYKKFQKFPKKITIVGFGFKRERFLSSHLTTLGYYKPTKEIKGMKDEEKWPDSVHVKYVSQGPFLEKSENQSDEEFKVYESEFWDSLGKSERENALALFNVNPFGSRGSKLYDKKIARDPWNKSQEITTTYKTNNEILNTLIEINDLELKDAMELYKQKVVPSFPLYIDHRNGN